MKSKLTADAALKIWAARKSGPLENPGPEGYATPSYGADEEQSIVIYVQATSGFAKAEPALKLKYIEGLNFTTRAEDVLCRRFERTLARRLIFRPWRKPEHSEELCGWDLAEQITAGANKDLQAATKRLMHP